MSFGFKNTCSHCSGPNIRKPTEGEFKAWLPTVGLPFPFKADSASTYDLVVSDSYIANVADEVTLSAELELSVDDSAIQVIDGSVVLEQEHNLSVSGSEVVNVAETPILEVLEDKLLVVEDAANANQSDAITLEVIAAPIVVKRGRRRAPVYFFPQPVPKEEVKPEVYTLQVQDGVVQTTADTVAMYEVVSLRVFDGKARVINIAPVAIRYYRSKLKIREDELLLMAA